MLYHFIGIHERSEPAALKIAVFHLASLVTLILLLTYSATFFGNDDELSENNMQVIFSIGVVMNCFYFPFAIALIIGINQDEINLIRIWIIATIGQLVFLFSVNLAGNIYMAASISRFYGISWIIVILIYSIFVLECLAFFNSYYQYRKIEKEISGQQKSYLGEINFI